MKVSFLEIYNETIRDLHRKKNSETIKHEIKQDCDGRRYVSGLTIKLIVPKDDEGISDVIYNYK